MKKLLGKVYCEFNKEALYSGEDADCFESMLREFIEKESKGFRYATFSYKPNDDFEVI